LKRRARVQYVKGEASIPDSGFNCDFYSVGPGSNFVYNLKQRIKYILELVEIQEYLHPNFTLPMTPVYPFPLDDVYETLHFVNITDILQFSVGYRRNPFLCFPIRCCFERALDMVQTLPVGRVIRIVDNRYSNRRTVFGIIAGYFVKDVSPFMKYKLEKLLKSMKSLQEICRLRSDEYPGDVMYVELLKHRLENVERLVGLCNNVERRYFMEVQLAEVNARDKEFVLKNNAFEELELADFRSRKIGLEVIEVCDHANSNVDDHVCESPYWSKKREFAWHNPLMPNTLQKSYCEYPLPDYCASARKLQEISEKFPSSVLFVPFQVYQDEATMQKTIQRKPNLMSLRPMILPNKQLNCFKNIFLFACMTDEIDATLQNEIMCDLLAEAECVQQIAYEDCHHSCLIFPVFFNYVGDMPVQCMPCGQLSFSAASPCIHCYVPKDQMGDPSYFEASHRKSSEMQVTVRKKLAGVELQQERNELARTHGLSLKVLDAPLQRVVSACYPQCLPPCFLHTYPLGMCKRVLHFCTSALSGQGFSFFEGACAGLFPHDCRARTLKCISEANGTDVTAVIEPLFYVFNALVRMARNTDRGLFKEDFSSMMLGNIAVRSGVYLKSFIVYLRLLA